MWIAAVRLSLLRTWHISCARIIFIWEGVSRSQIPSGSSNTGRNRPTTPGSIGVADDLAGIATFSSTGGAFLTSARRRSHCTIHRAPIAIVPQAHTPRTTSSQLTPGPCTALIGATGAPAGADLQLRCLPKSLNSENGIRNLHDAANHSP